MKRDGDDVMCDTCDGALFADIQQDEILRNDPDDDSKLNLFILDGEDHGEIYKFAQFNLGFHGGVVLNLPRDVRFDFSNV